MNRKRYDREMGKKGLTYMIAVSLIAVVLIGVFFGLDDVERQNRKAIDSKVNTMNEFVSDLNNDLENAGRISTYRAMIGLEDYIIRNEAFISDFQSIFREMMLNGTAEGEAVPIMENSTMRDYIKGVNVIADEKNLNASIDIGAVDLRHSGPWTLEAEFEAEVLLVEENNIARWDYTRNYTSQVGIEGLRDPLYSSFTDNRVASVIQQTPKPFDNSNKTILENHTRQGFYVASEDAPTFLDRFSNDVGNDTNGIERVMYLQELSDQDIEVYPDRPSIAFKYFNNIGGEYYCNFDGYDDTLRFNFTMDEMERYDLDSLDPSDYDEC